MPTFHYLNAKINEASQDQISLILSSLDVTYLKSHGVKLEEKIGNDGILRYITSVKHLKEVFSL